MSKRIGVLLSGRGSNFEALADSVRAGRIPDAEISIVISNREDAPGLLRATERGIAARAIPSKGLQREAYDRLVVAALNEARVDLVCLAGFMRLLSPYFVAAFPGRILNIHPSLLPSFPGLEAQRQALDYGVKFSGCTVHLVDENLDAGPIVAQADRSGEARRYGRDAGRTHSERGAPHLYGGGPPGAFGQVPHRRPPRAADDGRGPGGTAGRARQTRLKTPRLLF